MWSLYSGLCWMDNLHWIGFSVLGKKKRASWILFISASLDFEFLVTTLCFWLPWVCNTCNRMSFVGYYCFFLLLTEWIICCLGWIYYIWLSWVSIPFLFFVANILIMLAFLHFYKRGALIDIRLFLWIHRAINRCRF